ncbi:MAG: methionyl-tRNA formyltransferase [Planctomycetota bacterium]
MKIIFIGSSAFGVPTLKALAGQSRHPLIGVITQPDSKKGRGLKEVAVSPVKKEALKHKVEIWQPKSINDPAFIRQLDDKDPELIIVAAYGQKLGKEMLDLPPYGCLNIHPSLLPKYRGSAPVNYAILKGDAETGVSIIRMSEKMDAGFVIRQASVKIKDGETAPELEARLAEESAAIIAGLLDGMERGGLEETPQDESEATFAPKLKKTDGEIDWSRPAREIINRIRAMQPWPGAYTWLKPQGKAPVKVDITQARLNSDEGGKSGRPARTPPGGGPGRIIEINNNGIIISCGDEQKLSIIGVKPAGGRALTAREFANGYRLKTGDVLGKET